MLGPRGGPSVQVAPLRCSCARLFRSFGQRDLGGNLLILSAHVGQLGNLSVCFWGRALSHDHRCAGLRPEPFARWHHVLDSDSQRYFGRFWGTFDSFRIQADAFGYLPLFFVGFLRFSDVL